MTLSYSIKICQSVGRLLAIFVLIFILFSACTSPERTGIHDLQVEYMTNPLGVDIPHPRFTWKLFSDQRGVYQQSFQLIVSASIDDVKKKTGRVWDSGKINSRETINIEYSGIPLQSNRKYYWRVCVWTYPDNFYWSEPSFFHTGILDQSEWNAQWISTREEIVSESPLLRKEFEVQKKVEQAFVFVTACGFYELYLNGKKAGDHVLDPAITDYRKTILYSTYDVTSQLQKGTNVAGAMLANGAWNLHKTEGRWSWGAGGTSFGNPSFFMQLMINYTDGSQSVITSDNTWKYAPGPITFNNLYGGEDYDAGKELSSWNKKEFNDEGWKQVVISDDPRGKLKSQLMPPIKVTNTIQPVKTINPSPGVYLFDLGQNIAGWWRIEIKGSPGQVIRLRANETLNDSLFPTPLKEGDVLSTNFRYHNQIWTDYTLKSDKPEVYEPRFFYTGFRYIELTTSDNKNPEQLKVEGRVVRTALERNGTFKSSHPLLEKIHELGLWSQKGNSHGYPTDCPQREKGAYNGDGQVIAETSMHDFHMAAYYTKWINDMRDSQEENGRIPNTSPTLVGGMGGGVGWGSAYILIPYWMHHYYSDTRILQDHYPAMKKYLQYLKELGTKDENPDEPYIINNFYTYWYSLGEWCAPGQRDCPNHPVVNTFYYYYNSLLMSEIAGILGYSDDALYFTALSDTIKQEFNKKFFDPKTALYGTDETYQTYQLLALTGDLVPKEHRESVFQTIVDDIKMRNNHLNTGIIGTKYLWPVLVQGGKGDLAFTLATQTTYPGYGYWINNGSTTFPETWEGKNSHNHQMFGSVVEYFFKYLAGIQSPMEGNTAIGYRSIHIEPDIPVKLNSVNASVETISGTIVSDWEKTGDSFTHRISVPANTSATVALPVLNLKDITVLEGNSKIWDKGSYISGVPGILKVNKVKDRLIVSIESGNYVLVVKGKADDILLE